MELYFDTSVIVKIYVQEAGSAEVVDFLVRHGVPLALNILQEFELRNAFALKHFRGEISQKEYQALLAQLEHDIKLGRLRKIISVWPAVMQAAMGMSAKRSGEVGCRAIDIIHVAAAKIQKCSLFVTNDDRQMKLASLEGVKVVGIGGLPKAGGGGSSIS